jgi:hypothetical protein
MPASASPHVRVLWPGDRPNSVRLSVERLAPRRYRVEAELRGFKWVSVTCGSVREGFNRAITQILQGI